MSGFCILVKRNMIIPNTTKKDIEEQNKIKRNEIALKIAPTIIKEYYKDNCYGETSLMVEDIYTIANKMYKESLKEIT